MNNVALTPRFLFTSGISSHAALGAKKAGGIIIGINPYNSYKSTEFLTDGSLNLDYVDYVISTGLGYKARNFVTIFSADGIIVINGEYGTLNEVTIAIDHNKPIVAIKGTGGIADSLEAIIKKIRPYELVDYTNDPEMAVDLLINMLPNPVSLHNF
ncbi:MAG TPA: hypothetical protein EYP21_02220 [Syntrophaceae bacterium]|nr:hypothetical protein [Syntrophaceae bacterium]